MTQHHGKARAWFNRLGQNISHAVGNVESHLVHDAQSVITTAGGQLQGVASIAGSTVSNVAQTAGHTLEMPLIIGAVGLVLFVLMR